MTERTVIQLCVFKEASHGIVALCDDGSLWTKHTLLGNDDWTPWVQIEGVPQKNERYATPSP